MQIDAQPAEAEMSLAGNHTGRKGVLLTTLLVDTNVNGTADAGILQKLAKHTQLTRTQTLKS